MAAERRPHTFHHVMYCIRYMMTGVNKMIKYWS